jgi:PEP-CTERM motif
MQTRAMRLAIVIGLMASGTGLAQAGSLTYDISGQFGADQFGTSGLAGGSFVGSFSATNLPSTGGQVNLDGFDVALKNSQGETLNELTPGSYTGFIIGNVANNGFDGLYFTLTSSPTSSFLELFFATPFNGAGSVLPNPGLGTYSGAFVTSGQSIAFAQVASGSSVLAGSVPEPSSFTLALLGLLFGLGYYRRRCRLIP